VSHRPLPREGKRSARTSAVHVSLSSDSIVKQQRTWSEGLTPFGGRTGCPDLSIGWQEAQEAQKDDLPQLPEAARPSMGVYRSARGGLSTRICKNVALCAKAADCLALQRFTACEYKRIPPPSAPAARQSTYGGRAPFAPPSTGFLFRASFGAARIDSGCGPA
jgi:hypothetical protein